MKIFFLVILTVAAAVISITAFSASWKYVEWNVLTLPEFEEHGVKTIGKVVMIKRWNLRANARAKFVNVEHRPSGSDETYRNWLKSRRIQDLVYDPANENWWPEYEEKFGNRTTPFLKVGDHLKILYIPGDPEGRAIIEQDLLPEYQQEYVHPPWIAGMWLLSFLSIWLSKRFIKTEPEWHR